MYRLGEKRGKTVNITHVTISNDSYCLVFYTSPLQYGPNNLKANFKHDFSLSMTSDNRRSHASIICKQYKYIQLCSEELSSYYKMRYQNSCIEAMLQSNLLSP